MARVFEETLRRCNRREEPDVETKLVQCFTPSKFVISGNATWGSISQQTDVLESGISILAFHRKRTN